MRCKEQGVKTVFLPELGQYYRFHDGNMTQDRQAKQLGLLRLVKNRLDRGKAWQGREE